MKSPLFKRLAIILLINAMAGLVAYYFLVVQRGPDSNTLMISIDRMPNVLNPILPRNVQGIIMSNPLFGGLTRASGERVSELMFDMAAEINQREDKKNLYDLTLKRGLKWQDGVPVTSKDFLHTYESHIDPENESPLRGYLADVVQAVTVVDDLHLTIEFRVPVSPSDVPWVLNFELVPLTFRNRSMSSKYVSGDLGKEYSREPVGCGPYQIKSMGNNDIIFQRTRDDIPIEFVNFQLQYDQDIRVKKLIDKKIDLIFDVDPQYYDQLKTAKIRFSDYVPFAFYAVAFNMRSRPFSDVAFRKAVAYAINKSDIVRAALNVDAPQFVNRGPFPHNANRLYKQFGESNAFDLNESKKMLSKSNYSGEKVEILFASSYGSVGERMANGITSMLQKIGINAEAVELGRNFFSRIQSRDFGMALVYESDFNRRYNLAPLFHSQGAKNYTGIRDGDLDDLLFRWENAVVMDDKLPLAKKIHEKVCQDVPYVFLCTIPKRAYFSKRVQEVSIVDADALLGSIAKWRIVVEE